MIYGSLRKQHHQNSSDPNFILNTPRFVYIWAQANPEQVVCCCGIIGHAIESSTSMAQNDHIKRNFEFNVTRFVIMIHCVGIGSIFDHEKSSRFFASTNSSLL
jgi:hypothetical protein